MEGVRVLATPTERYIGIGSAAESPVMLLTRSVHTFSMSVPISIIVADLDGKVLRASVVGPRRVLRLSARRWVIEDRAGATLPLPGSQIIASTMPTRCPEH
jgi:hypothetical protein